MDPVALYLDTLRLIFDHNPKDPAASLPPPMGSGLRERLDAATKALPPQGLKPPDLTRLLWASYADASRLMICVNDRAADWEATWGMHRNRGREAWERLRVLHRQLWAETSTRPEDGPTPKGPARHSTDYRSVHWYGHDFTFTACQAAVVGVLWKNWGNGTPDVGQETLLADLDTKRLIDLFKEHPAWGVMIVPGDSKGSYRLRSPA
jgi:hypothetical protein